MEASLRARKNLEISFYHCGGPVMLLQACLCPRKDLESSFHYSASPVKLVQAGLSAGWCQISVLTAVEVL